jgi:hypothetical protein
MWDSLYSRDFGNPQLCDGTNACTPSMPPISQSHGDHHKIYIILGCVFGGLFIIFSIVFLLFCCYWTPWQSRRGRWQQVAGYIVLDVSHRRDNFAPAPLLGRGASSQVYSGTLVDGTEVTVKRAVRREPGPSQDLWGQFYRGTFSNANRL